MSGWPVFDRWAADKAALRAQSGYGGNKIPQSYLDKFNANSHAQFVKLGIIRADDPVYDDDLPGLPTKIDRFARLL